MSEMANPKVKFINAHLPWMLMMLLITIESALSGAVIDLQLFPFADKIIHFSIYAVLGWLLTRGFTKNQTPVLLKNYIWFVLLLGGLYGAIDELHQSIVPGRTPDITDWFADILGVTFAMIWFRVNYRTVFIVEDSKQNL